MQRSNRSSRGYAAILATFAAFLVFTAAACSPASEFDENGKLVQALSDGGDDMAGSPRIKPVYLKVNGATLAGVYGYYDTTLCVRCKPMRTSENKIRCIPEYPKMPNTMLSLPDFSDNVVVPGTFYLDGACSSDSYSWARPGTNATKYNGRYSVLSELIPQSEGVRAQTWVSKVFRVVGKVSRPMGILNSIDPSSGKCYAQYDLTDAVNLNGAEFYKSVPVALNTFAEMTETD